jgi:hypothetical protein
MAAAADSYSAEQYTLFAAMVFVYANFVWVGAVRPLLVVVVNLWRPLPSRSDWYAHGAHNARLSMLNGIGEVGTRGLMLFAMILALLIPLFIGTFYFLWAVRGQSGPHAVGRR